MDVPADTVQGLNKPQLMLLRDISGAFRPGVLTCLMGTSGAGLHIFCCIGTLLTRR